MKIASGQIEAGIAGGVDTTSDAPLAVNDELRAHFGLDADPLQRGGSGMMVADAGHRSLAEPLRTQVAEAAVERIRDIVEPLLDLALAGESATPAPAFVEVLVE